MLRERMAPVIKSQSKILNCQGRNPHALTCPSLFCRSREWRSCAAAWSPSFRRSETSSPLGWCASTHAWPQVNKLLLLLLLLLLRGGGGVGSATVDFVAAETAAAGLGGSFMALGWLAGWRAGGLVASAKAWRGLKSACSTAPPSHIGPVLLLLLLQWTSCAWDPSRCASGTAASSECRTCGPLRLTRWGGRREGASGDTLRSAGSP